MFCPKCGTEVKDGSSFCGNCGASLGDKAANAAGGVGAQNADSGAPASNAAASVAGTAAAAGAAKKIGKKKKGPIAIVAAIVVIVIVAVIGINVFGGVAVKDSTEAYTWDELSKISGEIAKASDESAAVEVAKKYHLTTADGKLDGTQTKSVTLSNGTQTAVQIVGFAHDEKADGGKAGITFIFKDCIGERSMNSTNTNAGGWEKSEMRSYLNSEGLNLLPAELKQKVVLVNKLTNNVGETQDVSSVTETADQLWLFSPTELCGTISHFSGSDAAYAACNDVLNAEGSEYKLFRDMNVNQDSSNNILVKNLNGHSNSWWERSPFPYNSGGFVFSGDGDPICLFGYGAENSYSVCPGFCI